ncbi:hypothetical protein WAI453_013652 [Rhynchosporium graminicola]
MDLFDELENLAVSATYEAPEDDSSTTPHDPDHATIKMWQDRFGYTYDEAAALISITKSTPMTSAQQPMITPAQARTIYLLKLDGPLSTPSKVQEIANLPAIPECHLGSSDDGSSMFCKVDGRAKLAIENWLSVHNKDLRPLFVPFGRAYKELSSTSLSPTLGIDTTLPQFRPQDLQFLDHAHSFGQKKRSVSRLASVKGGKMEIWGNGKYNALINGSEDSRIDGWAYMVISEEYEDALRKYETEAYEVVKCEIEMEGNEGHDPSVNTFRTLIFGCVDGSWTAELESNRNKLQEEVPSRVAISWLLRRSWFHRLWLFQEIVLATASTILVGEFSLDWELFRLGTFWLHTMTSKINLLSGISGIEFAQKSDLFGLLGETDRAKTMSLQLLSGLIMTKNWRCFDSRDRLYALRASWRAKEKAPANSRRLPTSDEQVLIACGKTDEGYIGLCPDSAKCGDILAVLLGCDVSLILRSKQNSLASFDIVGACYVTGIMNVETLLGPLPSGGTQRAMISKTEGVVMIYEQ